MGAMPPTPVSAGTESFTGELVDMPTTPRLARAPTPAPGTTQVLPRRALRGVREVTQGTLSVMEGRPGGMTDLAIGTAVRAGLIGLGFYLTGTKDLKKVVVGSLASSGIVTLVLLAGHAVVSRRSPGF